MDLHIEEGLLKASAESFKMQFSRDLDSSSEIDAKFLNNAELKELLENYTLITHSELTGKFLSNYQAELKQDILEYFDDKEPEYSLDNLYKIAFFRLQKACKKYYLEEVYGADEEKLTALKRHASRIRREYDIISALY